MGENLHVINESRQIFLYKSAMKYSEYYYIPSGVKIQRTQDNPFTCDIITAKWEWCVTTKAVTYRGDECITHHYETHIHPTNAWYFYFRLPEAARPFTAIRVHSQYLYSETK